MSDAPRDREPDGVTIETYGSIAQTYTERTQIRAPAVVAFLDRLAALAQAGGTVLELGSGPGVDADLLEQRGLRVHRSDATPAFVEMMRARGHEVRRLDVRTDALGGPFDAIFANAVLLHLPVDQFAAVLPRLRAATRPGGVLALTLKEGDGAGLTVGTVGLPRWFTLWRAPALRAALTCAGWLVESLEHVAGAEDDWLHVIARAPQTPSS